MKYYSRLTKFEDKRNIRRAVIFGVLTILSIILFFFYGLPLVAKFAGFLSDLRKSNSPVEIEDKTPPAPPRFESQPEATNRKKVDLVGITEPGATVFLTLNGEEEELIANSEGQFNQTFNLDNGENSFFALVRDEAGNESQKTETIKIIFDDTEPTLEISSPQEGASFFGSKQRQIVIDGKTEEGSSLTINDRFVLVENDGTFAFATTLSEGENSFNLKVNDKAGNQSEKSIKVNFTP